MRRLLLIVIPLLLLVTMIALSRAAAGWRYTLPSGPGDVMYVAAFDGFLDEWELYDDGQLAARAADGALRLSADAPNRTPFSVARPILGDFDLRVTATAVGGPLNNAFGVIFRMLDARNYYQFLVSSDGYYQVLRAVDSDTRELSTWIPSDAVRQGLNEPNVLRVVAVGSTFTFYVNGEPVELCVPDDPTARSTYNAISGECMEGEMRATLVDESLPAGHAGAVVQSFDEPGVVVEFDNLLVVGPRAS